MTEMRRCSSSWISPSSSISLLIPSTSSSTHTSDITICVAPSTAAVNWLQCIHNAVQIDTGSISRISLSLSLLLCRHQNKFWEKRLPMEYFQSEKRQPYTTFFWDKNPNVFVFKGFSFWWTLPDKNLWKTQQPMINIRQFIRLGYCEDNISVRKDKCQFAHKFPSGVGSMHICVVRQNNPIFLNFFSVSREWDCTITQTHPQWCNVAKPVQLKPINFPIPLNFTHQQIDVQNKQVMWPVCFIYITIQSWSCSQFHAVSYCLESRLWMCELDFKSFEA